MRSKADWLRVFEQTGTSVPLAEFVLSDLVGYRKTSLKRSEDIDTLVGLFEALMEHQKYID